MAHVYLSRREIVRSIPVLSGYCLLAPYGVLQARPAGESPTGLIRGNLFDAVSGERAAAKIRVTNLQSNQVYLPPGAPKTMPKQPKSRTGRYFYARGSFEAALPAGRYRIEVVRGICHQALASQVEIAPGTTQVLNFRLPMLEDLRAAGWYSGNTHTHYHLDIEESPEDRLRIVPPAEALDVSVISYLIRNRLAYPSNAFPIGRLPEFSREGTLVDMGEECRNNKASRGIGYGHCLFINIPRLVEPVSTGVLARDEEAPDFPTLSMLCAQARDIGGTTIWCHEGEGMETPVAVALGVVDAFNLGDSREPSYERYYQFLNCGFRLPASSGTDWWIYDHNRVFVRVQGEFRYDSWIAGLRAGRTFVSNGPLLELAVNGRGPGQLVRAAGPLKVVARAVSRVPFERLEIVQDGLVVSERSTAQYLAAKLEAVIAVQRSGWIAARITAGDHKTEAGFATFAHTSPVYIEVPGKPPSKVEAARAFVKEIEESSDFIRKSYRFAKDADRALALGRFEEARRFYAKLATEG